MWEMESVNHRNKWEWLSGGVKEIPIIKSKEKAKKGIVERFIEYKIIYWEMLSFDTSIDADHSCAMLDNTG